MNQLENITLVLTPDRTYTIERAILTAADSFEAHGLCYGHGTDSATDEASWLVLSAMDLSPALAPDYQQTLANDQLAACNEILQRRIDERIPAAYLTGQAWFAGLQLQADNRALIPRSPLAEFIQNDFFGLLENTRKHRILDLCTGGGCIAIACAHYLSKSSVDASDLSSDALSLARANVALHDLQDRIRLLQGSLFDPVDGQYNLIISNPPYVDASDIQSMPAEFHHEPMLGLAAGNDGLDLVRLMLEQAADYLLNDGHLVVEVGNSWLALEQAFPEIEFNWLEFSGGGTGVFMLTRQQLLQAGFC